MATSRRWFSVAFLCLSVAFSMSCSTFSSLGVGVSANGITPQNADRLKLVAEFPFFVDCTDYSIDSNRVAMYCGDVFLLYPELQSGSKRIRIEETSSMFSTALSPDGERMVTLIYEKSNLWNMKNSEKITEFPSSFGFATFSPDGKTIATTNPFDGDAIVRLWNASDGEAVGSLKTPDKSFGGGFHAAYSSNGKTLAIGSMSVAYLWDLVSPTPTAVFPMNSQVVWIGFSPGEKQLVATEIGNVHGYRRWKGIGLSSEST
jgi:WD40 repeat protein